MVCPPSATLSSCNPEINTYIKSISSRAVMLMRHFNRMDLMMFTAKKTLLSTVSTLVLSLQVCAPALWAADVHDDDGTGLASAASASAASASPSDRDALYTQELPEFPGLRVVVEKVTPTNRAAWQRYAEVQSHPRATDLAKNCMNGAGAAFFISTSL